MLQFKKKREKEHQQNVKTSPGPPRGVMVPLVLLVHPDPPWSPFLVKCQKVWIRMDRSGPGGPRGPLPPLVDQERSGPPWTTLRHFPDEKPIRFRWCKPGNKNLQMWIPKQKETTIYSVLQIARNHYNPWHQGNVGAWSKMVLNAPGPPRGVVVPVVHLVHSDPLWFTLLEILPKMWIRVDQGGPGGPGGP